jgi:DNA replication and repair protein RecF
MIEDIHSLITKSGKEDVKIKYISNSKDKNSFLENLKKSRDVDIKRGYTATGVHRDDFMIYINKKPVSIFGSQGQQRTIVLTLKLCELHIMKNELGESPILLLDDFMSELDEKRRTSVLENIKGNQVIITCTDKIELENESSVYYVENGICKKV